MILTRRFEHALNSSATRLAASGKQSRFGKQPIGTWTAFEHAPRKGGGDGRRLELRRYVQIRKQDFSYNQQFMKLCWRRSLKPYLPHIEAPVAYVHWPTQDTLVADQASEISLNEHIPLVVRIRSLRRCDNREETHEEGC